MTAPARSRRSTAALVAPGAKSARARDPVALVVPASQCESLIVSGIPHSGPASPRAVALSAASAARHARSSRRTANGLSGASSASARASTAPRASTADSSRRRRAARRSSAGRLQMSMGRQIRHSRDGVDGSGYHIVHHAADECAGTGRPVRLGARLVSRPQSAFTLGDLLAQEDLGLELLAGGDDAPARRVAGAHAIEIERPSTWLEPGWIMLTTGVRLRNNAARQRQLIAELQAADAAALGFGLDLVFKRVLAALLKKAHARAFPVFVVPLPVPFRDVISVVNRALASSDLRALQRLSSMQLYLMDALGRRPPGCGHRAPRGL